MTALTLTGWPALGRHLFPGVLASVVVAAAATFLSQHYGAPVMLFALLLGMAMNWFCRDNDAKHIGARVSPSAQKASE